VLQHTNLDTGVESEQEFEHGRLTWGTVGEYTAWKLTAEPGWRYSQHLGPLEGTESCQEDHLVFIVSGRMGTWMDNGEELENGPGDAVRIPPGHDAWTVGEDTLIALGVDPR
jgi:mannose-6-phosphate isomerase-like protein (cupin superfamily)